MRIRYWLGVIPLVGCSWPAPRPPSAEFLVADASSTYWVKSGPAGIHARVSPLILTRAGGRYYEVFVGENTRSYEDAVFTAEPIYRRDLITGDSTLLWQDPRIDAWERVYLARHPSATDRPRRMLATTRRRCRLQAKPISLALSDHTFSTRIARRSELGSGEQPTPRAEFSTFASARSVAIVSLSPATLRPFREEGSVSAISRGGTTQATTFSPASTARDARAR